MRFAGVRLGIRDGAKVGTDNPTAVNISQLLTTHPWPVTATWIWIWAKLV